MKVPLFFTGPGIKKGGSDALVYLLDVLPSLCDLTGTAVPSGSDAVSFAPIIQGKATEGRPTLFLAYRDVQRAIRDDRWKLIRYPQVDVTQLFDLKNDPYEMNDLAAEPAQGGRVIKLMAQLKEWQQQLGDTAPLSVAHPLSPKWTPPSADDLKNSQSPKKK
jgi:arylsulfatase A-like enzyme